MTEDDRPVTRAELKAELTELKVELKADLKAELRAELNTELNRFQTAMSEQMRDIETALLRAFHSYAHGVSAQFQRLTASDAAAEIRLSSLESRVLELETRRRN